MARQRIWVNVSEIELLRRRLGEVAAIGDGLPDGILQKFEHLLTIASDSSRQDEALRLATELFQFYYERQPKRRRPAEASYHLEPTLLAALDKFIAEHDGVKSRRQAIEILLRSALKDYIES